MEMKTIAAAVLVSSLGFAPMSGFADQVATLNVFARIPPENPCDITLDGNRTRLINLGTVNRSQPNIEMSRAVNVRITCNANRAVRIKLNDDREQSVIMPDPASVGIELPEGTNINALFIFTEGARNFGGLYSIRSSDWKAQIEQPPVDGQPPELGIPEDVDIADVETDTVISADTPLLKNTDYFFKAKIENPTNPQVTAKVFAGKVEVFTKGARISKSAKGVLQGITQIEAFYL